MFGNADPNCKNCGWKLTPNEDGQGWSCPLCGSVYITADNDISSSIVNGRSGPEPAVSEENAKLALNAALKVAQDSIKHCEKRRK